MSHAEVSTLSQINNKSLLRLLLLELLDSRITMQREFAQLLSFFGSHIIHLSFEQLKVLLHFFSFHSQLAISFVAFSRVLLHLGAKLSDGVLQRIHSPKERTSKVTQLVGHNLSFIAYCAFESLFYGKYLINWQVCGAYTWEDWFNPHLLR